MPKNAEIRGMLVRDFIYDLDHDEPIGPLVSDFVRNLPPVVPHIDEALGPAVSEFVHTLTEEVPPTDNVGHQVSAFVQDWLL